MTVFALSVFNPAVFFADGEGLTFAANANASGVTTSSVVGLQIVSRNVFADGLATGTANSDAISILAAESESAGVSLAYGSGGATAGTMAVSLGNSVVLGIQVTRFPTALRPTSASGMRARQASSGLRPAQLSIGRR